MSLGKHKLLKSILMLIC